MRDSRGIIMQLALATIIGMPLVAVIIDRFSETVNLARVVIGFAPVWQQVAAGVIMGLAIALAAQFIISRPFMKAVNVRYTNLLGNFNLTFNEILFVSLCAGIGEELLFRGALQPLFGIVFVAILFVGIHGYLNPRDWRITVYGIFMSAAMCVIGYSVELFGLLSAIIAHTIIDIYLLRQMMKQFETTEQQSSANDSSDPNNPTNP